MQKETPIDKAVTGKGDVVKVEDIVKMLLDKGAKFSSNLKDKNVCARVPTRLPHGWRHACNTQPSTGRKS